MRRGSATQLSGIPFPETPLHEYDQKDSSYFEWNRTDIVPYLPPTAERICEIGCGTGITLAEMKRRYNASWTAGVDIHEPSIEIARGRVDKASVVDIENAPLPEEIKDIDLFLCLDVLEHLRDPWRVLGLVHARLRPGGCVVASIPNIQHYSVSVGLLFGGRWELTDAGLLDRTHLRFFVRGTAIELMESSGLRIDAIGAKYRRRRDKAVGVMTGGLLEGILAFQYIIRATKVAPAAGG